MVKLSRNRFCFSQKLFEDLRQKLHELARHEIWSARKTWHWPFQERRTLAPLIQAKRF
jgi:hypothetical protein